MSSIPDLPIEAWKWLQDEKLVLVDTRTAELVKRYAELAKTRQSSKAAG